MIDEYDDGGVVEWLEDKLRRDYHAHLAAHPHPRDPDHPDPEEYGIFEEDEMRRAAMQQALDALEGSRRSHHYCEDPWYSCPQHETGCANEAEGDECNCGADKANEKIDQAITALKQALAEPDSDYERGFVDGMNLQTKGSVDKAVNRMAQTTHWEGCEAVHPECKEKNT